MTTVDEIIKRARLFINNKNVAYKLGQGGINPDRSSPSNIDGFCDCSGFICWCLGISRMTKDITAVKFNGGWINTDLIVFDAQVSTGQFEKLIVPRVGALIVYGSKGLVKRIGHVGIISSVQQNGIKVIHCSSGNYKKTEAAIQETGIDIFAKQPDLIYAWWAGIAE